MQAVQRICFILLVSALISAQEATTPPDKQGLEHQVKDLLDAMATQQKAMAAQQNAMADQQKQIARQQEEIESLKNQLGTQPKATAVAAGSQQPQLVNASLNTSNANNTPRTASLADYQEPKESPLSFRIGGAEFTPGGFLDFTGIFRSTNTGNLGTNFYAIPFSNTVQGHLTESRFTAGNSRINLKVTEKFGGNDVTGFVEADFLGNNGSNVFVTSNSDTMRLRHYWADVRHGKWEILGGQTWSWLTPNRVGVSAESQNVFYSQDMDFNYQAGLTWTRAPQFRVAYHANDHWVLGVAVENAEQFAGQTAAGTPEITFPRAFNAQLTPQFDGGSNSATPNMHPDVIAKTAYDTDFHGRHFHMEAAGLLSTVKITNLPAVANSTFESHSKTGGGVEAALNLELMKGIRFVSSGFLSDGGGRYIFGMGPDAVVLPNAAGTDVNISLVHSGSGIMGFEAQVTPKTMFYGYYGGAYFQRNFALDTSAGAPANSFIGFGGPNSPNSSNRAIQEGTIGWTQTFWKSPQYGALQLITQYSYLTRSPWFVAAGAPKNAHLSMPWVDFRYVLP
ncbi:MAG TPA: hypothetical protein VKZ53_02560 [Candidatus Angelobacter sp.]|nr:hypothetical protein [Candidatus Angelobacter sp.]